uniref:Uncharacterized protein n=1 Tax=Anguilla anguilla TaxID=7936 RepID=A0A0E9XY33_ANGAN
MTDTPGAPVSQMF